jgi:hypothetical protein
MTSDAPAGEEVADLLYRFTVPGIAAPMPAPVAEPSRETGEP